MTERIIYSKDNENFNTDCVGDIIVDIINESFEELKVGDTITYYEAVARDFIPSDFITDHRIDNFIDDLNCAACDEAGEYAEDFGYCNPEDREELKALIGVWADKYLSCSFWGVDKSKQIDVVVTQEMLD